jgi:hypothetical protein
MDKQASMLHETCYYKFAEGQGQSGHEPPFPGEAIISDRSRIGPLPNVGLRFYMRKELFASA